MRRGGVYLHTGSAGVRVRLHGGVKTCRYPSLGGCG